MAALSAIAFNEELKAFYKRKVGEGNKSLVLKMLCSGRGIRAWAAVTGGRASTVLALSKGAADAMVLTPQKHYYRRVPMDAQWSYVAKKEKNVWSLYA